MAAKLLVTLGPASLREDVIKKIDQYGIFVFRINLSHTSIDKLEETINTIRKYTDTPICLDSEGAQIRNQTVQGGEVYFKEGEEVKIHFEEVEGDSKNISFTPTGIVKQFKIGDIIYIDFNEVSLKIISVNQDGCNAVVITGGKVGSNKAVDLNRDIELPSITSKDYKAVELGKEMGIKHFALSFAGSKADVKNFRSSIGSDSYMISKIESLDGLLNLSDIIENTDAILIDRGDLSRQVPIEKIPFFQRRIVSLARSRGKKVFVATNLLETMVKTRQPTRAEVNDVVSTLNMGASGLVLAAETAIGHYPVECAKIIRKLIQQFERWTPNTSIEELLYG
ncbi:Pyruvate kinase [Candidatus Magnetomoraceae bacterium gMMP-15]